METLLPLLPYLLGTPALVHSSSAQRCGQWIEMKFLHLFSVPGLGKPI